MYLKIQKINNELLGKSKKYFSSEYISNLRKNKKSTFNESLISRYLIEKNKLEYSCISHKKDLVFIGVSDINIGVDIEVYKKRDISVLNIFSDLEYSLFGLKCLVNFYLLWTMKESIIKLLNITLDDMKNIKIINLKEKKQNISGIIFNFESLFMYNNKKIKVITGKKDEYYFSVCYF